MTAIDVTYRFAGELRPDQIRALSDAFDIYGVRSIKVDEAACLLSIEYDATRMGEPVVAGIVRRCRINIVETVSSPITA